MIPLKSIHPSFISTNVKYTIHCTRILNARGSILCLCKSNDSDSETPQPGDTRKQDLLAQIAMLQARKVRVTDYIDDRSAYLTQFGDEAKTELDKIGEDALKGLDEAGERIIANIESQMLEFEESAKLNKQEIQNRENKLEEFEVQMEDDRNEGLFFKNLRKKEPVDIAKAKEESEKIKQVTREKVGSKTRKIIYLIFIGLLTFGIVESIASSSTDWRKVAFLGAILAALISQFIYEQNMVSETGTTKKTNNDEKRE
ncbi:hypothetical protein TanjilG_14477 [Lupinus angustifolius]|uniref:8-amino-7-oxononanoate synthase n=2 Tax=Lupinus angustifolius TaxID=3871 RepID=A0A1J7I3Z0_LUPAN|nr:PREDICTED: uncharacterized protein LOC109352627 isoform X2 [Lupinus angustifolius]OIW07531.1 hypothetical protein TanjilG_14477 [Lupinus angustifolius]